jgi:U4/U6 small nuclear ribonucleoprotein PRP31
MAAASGKLKLTAKPTKMKVPKNVQKKLMNYGSGGATNGLSSSLAFTPIQGIELANPTINKDATSGTDSVFSEMRGFRKVTAAGLQRQLKD